MSIARVQSTTAVGAGSVSSAIITLGSTPISGNIIVVAAAYLDTASDPGASCDFSATNITFITAAPSVQGASSTSVCIGIGRVRASPGSAITVTVGGIGGLAIAAAEYSGLSQNWDKVANGTNSSTSVTCGTTATTESANQLWIGAAAHRATSGGTFSSPGNGFSIVAQAKTALGTTSDRSICLLEKIVTATGAANPTVTVAPTGVYVGKTITIEEIVAAASGMLFIPDLSGT